MTPDLDIDVERTSIGYLAIDRNQYDGADDGHLTYGSGPTAAAAVVDLLEQYEIWEGQLYELAVRNVNAYVRYFFRLDRYKRGFRDEFRDPRDAALKLRGKVLERRVLTRRIAA